MYTLPTTIRIDDKEYTIRNKGDYRMVLDCFSALNDDEIDENYRVLISLFIFYDCVNDIDEIEDYFGDNLDTAVKKMFEFFNCNQPESYSHTNTNVVDWENDSQLICSAINNVSHIEVRALDYLHWWTFMGYYMSIGESAFSTVISIRHKLSKGKKLEQYEKDFRKDNPQYFVKKMSAEERAYEEYIKNLWGANND